MSARARAVMSFVRKNDFEVIEERDEQLEESDEEFDRVEFTLETLQLAQPRKMTVAVCTGRSRMRVETGPDWRRGGGATWALVSIPPRASREAIVLALAELKSLRADETPPYTLDVLLARAKAR